MNEQLIQAGMQILQAAQQGDQQAAQIVQQAQAVMQDPQQQQQLTQAAQQGDKGAMAILAVIMAANQAQSAKFGAKLNYIQKLRGICPEGYEMQYFKQGGKTCKKCQKIKMQEGGETPKNAVDAFKCGRKMKRKAACGTKLPKDKCGNKVEVDKCGKKVKKKEDGGDIEKAQGGTQTKPTAPSAKKRYNKGNYSVLPIVGTDPNNAVYVEMISQNQGFGPHIESPAIISRKIDSRRYFGHQQPDTMYTEFPNHMPFVNVQHRYARNTDNNRLEYETLRRRFNEAKSVSK